jgi:hypothetical protein
MRFSGIRSHLRPYSIVKNRTTTINHAFAAAIAPCDKYDELEVRQAIQLLGQDPDQELRCVYCDDLAETWDHVFATVSNKQFSGFGHRLGNLLPCCKRCNSKKGNKSWLVYLRSIAGSDEMATRRSLAIEAYLERYSRRDAIPTGSPEFTELQRIHQAILNLFHEADKLAERLRKDGQT